MYGRVWMVRWLLLTTVIASVGASAQVTNSRIIGPWFVAEVHSQQFATQCWLSNNNYPDGTTIRVEIKTDTGSTKIAFENADWRSLPGPSAPDADRQMPVHLTFSGTDQVYDGNFTGVSGLESYGMKPQLYRHFTLEEATPVLLALGRAASVQVLAGGRQVGSYPLTSSKDAIGALIGCAQSVTSERQRRLENDPFRR